MKFIKHSYLALEEVHLKCWKLLLRYSPSSIKDRQFRENRAMARFLIEYPFCVCLVLRYTEDMSKSRVGNRRGGIAVFY